MLVLSGRVGQRIRISDTVTVVVVEVCGNRVRLGIEAPRQVAVYRAEMLTPEQRKALPREEPRRG